MKYIFLTLFLTLNITVQAQNNLVQNGDFENGTSHWYFPYSFAFERTTDAHTGNYAGKVYANSGTFYHQADISVNAHNQYVASYWFKGYVFADNLEMIISWYNSSDQLLERDFLGKVSISTQWEKKETTVTAPHGASYASIAFYVSRGNGYIFIDDVSLTHENTNNNQPIAPPTDITAKAFQREIDLKWNRQSGTELAWEIFVNNQSIATTNNNQYTITLLDPNQLYHIKIKTIQGNDSSDFSTPINIRTSDMNKNINDIDRVPHLRTLNIDGICSDSLELYYNDLGNKNATFRYFLNHTEVFPTENKLHFSKKGIHHLKIMIEESADMQWELEYVLDIQ